MESPTISFITICYNGFKDTCKLIESLLDKIHSISYEIIVVDNASRENEAEKIRALYPTVITIRSDVNKGFFGRKQYRTPCSKRQIFFLDKQ